MTSEQQQLVPIPTSELTNDQTCATTNTMRTLEVLTFNIYPQHQIIETQQFNAPLMSNTITTTPLLRTPTPIKYTHHDSLVLPRTEPTAFSTVGFTLRPFELTNVLERQMDTFPASRQPLVLKISQANAANMLGHRKTMPQGPCSAENAHNQQATHSST